MRPNNTPWYQPFAFLTINFKFGTWDDFTCSFLNKERALLWLNEQNRWMEEDQLNCKLYLMSRHD